MTNKERLDANNLKIKEIQETLKNKILKASGNGEFVCRVVDYDGTILKEQELNNGDVFELPEPPSHNGLVFHEYVCAVPIEDNKIAVEDRDIIVGPSYTTASGLNEFDIELTKALESDISTNGYVVTLNLSGTKDWGDGTIDTETTHTYYSYGKYTITCDGTEFPSYVFGQLDGDKTNQYVVEIRLGNVTSLAKQYIFAYCTSLKNIVLPINITSFGNYLLFESSNLQTLIFPKSVKELAFYSCSRLYSLKNIVMGTNISKLGTMFCMESKIEYITLPDFSYAIGFFSEYVFSNCTELKAVTLPKCTDESHDYISIGKNFCSGCTKLTKVRFLDTYHVYSFVEGNSSNANFLNCVSLKEFNFPEKSTMSKYMLSGANSLEKITLPLNDSNIRDYFCNNTNVLKFIKFPSQITNIGNYAFRSSADERIFDFSEHTQVPTLGGTKTFESIKGLSKIIVPDALYDEWIVATNWATYANYIYKASEVQL